MEDRRLRPIEFFVVGTDPETGAEEWFRTIHIQGMRKDTLGKAMRTGCEAYGRRWRKVPVRYRLVSCYGQEFDAVWDAKEKGFRLEGGMLVGPGWMSRVEEIVEE